MKKKNGEITEKWIRIKYDYVPKYCKTCMIQGYNEQQCYMEYPKLYPKRGGRKKQMTNKRKKIQKTILRQSVICKKEKMTNDKK